jgi:diguanylate cyclase (GGDEF)-like protein
MELDNSEIDKLAKEKARAEYERLRQECEQNSGTLLRQIAEMHLHTAHLERNAELNPLTEIANKKRAEKVFEAAQKHPDFVSGKSVLVVVRMDADGFKEVNDTYGHQEGDTVLKRIAEQLEQELAHLRPTDLAVHFSGDEFGLLLLVNKPTNKKATVDSVVEKILERVIKGVEKIQLPNKKYMTASAGFQIIDKESSADFPTADHLADTAAGLAKQCKYVKGFEKGSNRIVNKGLTKAQFLEKKGISIDQYEDSSLRGQIDRLSKQVFDGDAPKEAEIVLEMLLNLAKKKKVERRTGPTPIKP